MTLRDLNWLKTNLQRHEASRGLSATVELFLIISVDISGGIRRSEIFATSHISWVPKIAFAAGLCPETRWGSLEQSPYLLAGLKGKEEKKKKEKGWMMRMEREGEREREGAKDRERECPEIHYCLHRCGYDTTIYI